METFATYLIKSSVWLTGFALIFVLFLRNERFFTLNRIYLVSGILFSIIFPLFTWHYTVLLPVVPTTEVIEPQFQQITAMPEKSFNTQNLLLLAYLAGILYLIFRILRQTLPVFRIIRKSEIHQHSSAKLIRTDEYPASFSFFSFVFVNPSIDEIETNEILNHELEHIRQQHWIDLLLFEILRTMQWFNPVSWLYGHLIRQNHEYLADEWALQRSSNPAVYRAALLNQLFDGPVISLANSINYSLNKKRFNMMKENISSPLRKLKLLVVLPLIAGVFYAFATPEYKYIQTGDNTKTRQVIADGNTIHGKVIAEDGKPLKGAWVVVSKKTIGTVTDANGNFKLILTDDSPIVISYVGFGSQTVKPDFEKEMIITMKTITIGIEAVGNDDVSENIYMGPGDNFLIDGKGKEALSDVFYFVEEMPSFPGGIDALKAFIKATVKYPVAAFESGIQGMVYVNFVVTKTGSITKAKVVRSLDASLDKEAIRVVEAMPNWNPGKQGGENVDVSYTVPVSFVLQPNNISKEPTTLSKIYDDIYLKVEEMPSFFGGVEALRAFIYTNLKYPAIALENGIIGQVFVKFLVDKTGSITNVKISRGVDPSLDKEALRIVNSMPKWNPGKQNGENVEVAYEMPINFNIPADYHSISQEKLRSNASSKIGNISWVNNTVFSSVELNKVLRLQKGDQYSKELINRRILTDMDGIYSIYRNNGYAFSKIEIAETPVHDCSVDLIFTVYEGNLGKIGKIVIKGNKNVSTEEILSKIAIKPGDLFSKTKIIKSVAAISKMGKFDSEAIKPVVIPVSQNFSEKFSIVDIVFNVIEI